uniref:Uncharacterized protein n=1 Tax=Anopheles dirus TaxID=7168 RepID=A0A182N528_9DIPT
MGGELGRWWCWALVWLCTVSFPALTAETIHFTNSPKLIMASKNFTTYEIAVPGSKPITIIEANDPYDRTASLRPVQSFPAEVQLTPGGPTTSFRTSTGLSVGRPASSDEGSGTGSTEQTGAGPRKTLYSPELLNKFLKEYSEKLRNADAATRKRLNEITIINSVNRNQNEQPQPVGAPDAHQYRNRHQPALDAIQAESQGESAEPADEPKAADEFVFDDTHERHVGFGVNSNKRWYQEPPAATGGHKSHPWNIKDGWVTLEAVPWSESKVAKWHAEAHRHQHPHQVKAPTAQYALDKHWNAGGSASDETPKYKPLSTSGSIGASSYYGGADTEDDYGYGSASNRLSSPTPPPPPAPSPPESLYNRRRPTVTLYSERPDAEPSRPASPTQHQQQPPVDSWYEQQHLQLSNAYDSMKESTPTVHSNRDIITDGRPANFPPYAPDHPGPSRGSYTVDSAPSDQRNRPGTYPDRGNGEWVLISTTKGYQYPKRRHGQRAITFAPASTTSHQSVKLTVLPMKNAVDMTTSHNGLIEVSASTQTVEDAVRKQQQQQQQKRKGQVRPNPTSNSVGVAGHVKKKKHSTSAAGSAQTFSLMRRDAAQDSSAVLAAVGAGMVPATMAILAPMVLGKKK